MAVPKHIAFIMDGNGRWAQAKGLPRSAGHRAGLERIEDVLRACRRLGVEVVSVFGWSIENWSRPKAEVAYILRALETRLPEMVKRLHAQGVRFVHSGDCSRLSEKARRVLRQATDLTRDNGPFTFNLAFNYGGRDDILNAVRGVVSAGLAPEAITEETIGERLWSYPLPDIDLLVRSGNEARISNFMLWQAARAEIYITPSYWPDVGEPEVEEAIGHYGRSRREKALDG